ncbi:MAG: Nif3-like dinuclear metal center hexameric protein [Actinomycetota bacterium]
MHGVPSVADWTNLVHRLFPPETAASWDRVGLQVGDPSAPVSTVTVCLDATIATLEEARAAGAGLVVSHHPLIFRPLQAVRTDEPVGGLVAKALASRVALLACHTNFDADPRSTSYPVAKLLGLRECRPLEAAAEPAEVKLVTFCPLEATERVLEALAGAGAGVIGDYTRCSFRVRGTGTFVPGAGARPAIGEREVLNAVEEDRLEVVVPAAAAPRALAALRAVHPYEEVAVDVYPLSPHGVRGFGTVGDLPAPLALGELAGLVREGLPSPLLRFAGDEARTVRRVAVCGGGGGEYVAAASAAGAQCLISGDLSHHAATEAMARGLALIDAGHAATEAAALPALAERLRASASAEGWQADVLVSSLPADPFRGGGSDGR